ncbi:MAG: hypothetical protein IPJ84_17870 [Bdellovibrionales bacterium]|nr:hypothetical protein [Bdellovibrionales bacterium]
MKIFISALFVTLLLYRTAAFAADLGGLQVFGALDLASELGIENPTPDGGRLKVRSFEVAVSGPVDPLFDALINIAGHDESGTIEVELHEAVISSSRLVPGVRLRAGRFLLGIGRLNQFHSHDWPFFSAPKMQSLFFAEEAVTDSGVEVGYLLPWDTGVPIDIVAGATNGWSYGHTHTGGQRPLTPTHYLHPSVFIEGDSPGVGTQLGLNYLGRTDADSLRLQLTGIDLTHKRRTGKRLDFLLQAEVFHRLRAKATLDNMEDVAGYLYSEWALDDTWSAGVRADVYSDLSLKFGTGDARKNLDYGFVPVLTYRPSEFSRLQFSYSLQTETKEGDQNRNEQVVFIQLVSMIGAHPAHDF